MSIFNGKRAIFRIKPAANNADREKKVERINQDLINETLRQEYEKCRRIR